MDPEGQPDSSIVIRIFSQDVWNENLCYNNLHAIASKEGNIY